MRFEKLGSDYLRAAEKQHMDGGSLNSVRLRGELAKDPDYKVGVTGNPVCSFQLITTDKWIDSFGQHHQKSEWHKVTVFGRHAEIAGGLKKGHRLYLEGRLQTSSWDDSSGQKRTRTLVIGSAVYPLQGLAEKGA